MVNTADTACIDTVRGRITHKLIVAAPSRRLVPASPVRGVELETASQDVEIETRADPQEGCGTEEQLARSSHTGRSSHRKRGL